MPDDEHPLMVMMLQSSSFLGLAEKVENEVMPLDSQRDLKPGDTAVVVYANTPLEDDLTFAKVVNAQKHAEQFPDWEERVELKSFLLCDVFSQHDPVPHLGWYSRLKLLPITKYRYAQVKLWRKAGFPDELPGWLVKTQDDYQVAMSEKVPEIVPKPVECPTCGKRNVYFEVYRYANYSARAGQFQAAQDQTKYTPIEKVEQHENHIVSLVCRDCTAATLIQDGDWEMPGVTHPVLP